MKLLRYMSIVFTLLLILNTVLFAKTNYLPRQFEMSPTAIEYFSKECGMEVTSGMITYDPENASAKIEAFGIKDGIRWEISAYWKNGYFMMITFSNPKQIKGGS
jgi:hypothetical protein